MHHLYGEAIYKLIKRVDSIGPLQRAIGAGMMKTIIEHWDLITNDYTILTPDLL